MKKLFKPISLFLTFLMILSCFTTVFAVEVKKETIEEVNINGAYENVSIIIELEQKPLLDSIQAQTYGAKEYLQTDTAKSMKQVIVNAQKSIQEEIISTINSNAIFKFNYTNTINGFAATVSRKDISKIKALPGVKAVYMDLIYEIPENEADPRLQTSADMIGATNVWGLENYKGEGTVVAVIDTGVDVNHEYMVVSDGTEVKLTKESIATVIANSELNASTLVTGLTSDDVYYNRKFPYCFDYIDNDTDAHADSSNHGVHVSGIVAANGTVAQYQAKTSGTTLNTNVEFNGVAPEAQIIGMKVFPSEGGGAPTSATIAAVEDAVSLGVDAIKLSLGSTAGFSFYEGLDLTIYEQEYSFELARDAGIVVAVAAGNDDRAGILSYIYQLSNGGYAFPSTSYVDNGLVGSPGTKYHATTVASIENQTLVLPYLTSGEGLKFYYNDNTDFVNRLDGQTLEYVVVPGLGEEKDFEGLDVTGKIALIERGTINFSQKVINAQNAGAVAVIIYNNAANGDSRGGMLLDGVDIPAILIGRTFGLSLVNAAEASKTIIVDSSCTEGIFESPTMGLMSDFTSWGSNPDLKLKPEITAPGSNIYSTSTGNQYVTMSGTSMASPHIAGAAALLQQYVKDDPKFAHLTAEERGNVIESLLMSTADIIYDEEGGQYSPRRQGSGLANIEKAINSSVYLLNATTGKTKVELGDKLSNTFDIEFDAYNLSNVDCDYELVGSVFIEDAVKLGSYGYFIIPYSSNLRYAEMFSDEHTINPGYALTPSGITGSAIVTVPAGEGVHIKVTVELDEEEVQYYNTRFDNGFFVEGFIEMNSLDDQPDLSIPYMGFYGDWNAAPIVDGSYYFEPYANESGTRNYFYGNSYPYSLEYDENGEMTGRVYALGSNFEGSIYAYPLIAFSPNGDYYFDDMGYKANLLRNAKTLQVYVLDSAGNLVRTLVDDIYWRKTFADYAGGYYLNSEWLNTWDGRDNEGNLVNDGQYYYVISATIDYDGATPQNTFIPVKVDTKVPTVQSAVLDEENLTLTVKATDETYLSYAAVIDSVSDEHIINSLQVPSKNGEFVIDVSSFTGNVEFYIGDVAGNEYYGVVENPNKNDTYNVTFRLDGGKINDSTSDIIVEVVENKCVTRPADPVKTGYAFTGWYEEGSSEKFDFTTLITKNTTLTAKYNNNQDTGVDPGSGTGPGSGSGSGSNTTPTTPSDSSETVIPDNMKNINITEDSAEISINSKAIDIIEEGNNDVILLQIDKIDNINNYAFNISSDIVKALKDNNKTIKFEIKNILNFIINPDTYGDIQAIASNIDTGNIPAQYATTNLNFDIVANQNGSNISNQNKVLKVEIDAAGLSNLDKLGVYTVDENGDLEYVMTYLNGDVISFYPPHFSPYHVMIYNKTFEDIKGHWAQNYIENMASKHVVKGKTENTFDPEAIVTRAEFVTMVVRALGLKGEGKDQFADISKDKWYANYISLAKDAGLVDGKTYNAEGIISRGEMAKIIARAHAILNGTKLDFKGNLKFNDVDINSEYAEFIGYANENGLINGFPGDLFMPVENTTRAQAMTVIYKLINK